MRRCIVRYSFPKGKGKQREERECEAVLFSDGSFYLHGSSIAPPEFDDTDEFEKFMSSNYSSHTIEWVDAEVLV